MAVVSMEARRTAGATSSPAAEATPTAGGALSMVSMTMDDAVVEGISSDVDGSCGDSGSVLACDSPGMTIDDDVDADEENGDTVPPTPRPPFTASSVSL